MIYCTTGVPSRFSEWCEALLEALLAESGCRPASFVAEDLDQIGHGLLVRRGGDVLVVARQPNAGLVKALLAITPPFLITLDSPGNTVGALMTDYGVPFAEAVRRTASSLAALVPVVTAKNALVLRQSDALSADAVAAAMTGHFDLPLSAATQSAVAARCPLRAAVAAVPPVFDDEPLPLPFATLQRSGASSAHTAALEPLWSHLNGTPLGEIVWTAELFRCGDAPGEAAIHPFDVTGSGRCLSFGPYIRLPEGPWSCSMTCGFSERAVGLRLVADVTAGVALNQVHFEIDEPGVFEVEFSFVNSNPDLPVEVRLFSACAAFEGEIMLGNVRLAPLKAKRLTVS